MKKGAAAVPRDPRQRSIASFFTASTTKTNSTKKEDDTVVVVVEEEEEEERTTDQTSSRKRKEQMLEVEPPQPSNKMLKERNELPHEHGVDKAEVDQLLPSSTSNNNNGDETTTTLWPPGKDVPFVHLAGCFGRVEQISGRLQIVDMLCDMFRAIVTLSPQFLLPCFYLCTNKIAPASAGVELGVGESLLIRAISEATGLSPVNVKRRLKETGDLGLVAEHAKANQRSLWAPPPLTAAKLLKTLQEIATTKGQSSTKKKVDMIKGLLVAASNEEARYVIRILQGTLRIGVLEKTLIAALAKAICFTPSLLFNEAKEKETASSLLQLSTSGQPTKETFEWAAQTLQRIFNEMTSYDVIIPALVENGLYALSHQSLLTPGVAVKPMLAQPTSGLQDLTKRFGESSCFVCEYKYDGERAHLHLTPDGKVFIFSRRCEDHTAKFPDVVQMLSSVKNETVESCILDGEIVAYDRANNSLLPFQALTTRSRKDVRLESLTVHVCFYAFDLLYLNGKALIEESLETRRSLLEANFKAAEGHFQYVRSVICSSEREAEQFLNEALAASCIEGIVAKLWSSEYALAKRAYHWLKVKRDYVDGMVETVDLVVMGGYHGHGKRVGVYGSYLLGVWDEDAEEYQTLCKCMTGYTDEFLAQSAAFFNDGQCLERAPSYYRYTSGNGNGGGSEPDQWFKPVKVWEIMSADITLSPVHKAAVGLVAESKGLSLRFPRFKREREDKAPEDATTAAQIARMYLAQQK